MAESQIVMQPLRNFWIVYFKKPTRHRGIDGLSAMAGRGVGVGSDAFCQHVRTEIGFTGQGQRGSIAAEEKIQTFKSV